MTTSFVVRAPRVDKGPDAPTVVAESRARPADDVMARLAIAALALLHALLALSTLDDRGLWVDEAYTKSVATTPWDRLLGDLTYNGANMSLYLMLMRGWLVLGESDWWMRVPSAFLSTACVPAFYALARKVVGTPAAVAGAGLVAISAPLLHQAQDARSYPLTTLLVIVSWWAAIGLGRDPSRRRRWIYLVLAVAAVYAHLMAVFFVAAQLLWLVAAQRRTALRVAGWTAVLLAPQLFAGLAPGAKEPSWIPQTSGWTLRATLRFLTGTPSNAAALVVGALWLASGIVAWRSRQHLATAPIAWVVVPVCGLLVVSVASPMFLPRYLVMLVPGGVLLLCMLVERVPRLGAAAVGAVVLLTIPALADTLTRPGPDWRSATRLVAERAEPDEAILLVESRQLVEHYWDQVGRPSPMPRLLTTPAKWGEMRRVYEFDPKAAEATLDEIRGVWVVQRWDKVDEYPEFAAFLGEVQRRWRPTFEWRSESGEISIVRYNGRAGT